MDARLHISYRFSRQKMNKFCGLVYRLSDALMTAQLIKTNFSHIQPKLQNWVIVYGTDNKTSVQKN